MHILALDVGIASVKAAILDVASARPVGTVAQTAYELDVPVADAAEVPAQRLWAAVTAASRQVARSVEGIAGVGLACVMPTLVLLDEADRPVAPFWMPLDRRARPAPRQVWAAVGAEFLASTGNRPLPGGMTAICWRQQLHDDPYLARRVRRYLHLNGWLGLHLTGQAAFDPGNACCTGLYGTLTNQAWSERWCDYFEVDPVWLSPVLDGRTTLGTLRSSAAAELGVPGGLPVKLGTSDLSTAVLAAGMGPHELLHVVGATDVLAALTDHPMPSDRRLTGQLGVGTTFLHVTHNPVGGAALGWIHKLCFREQSRREFSEQTIPAARQRRTRVTLDPPHLGGDRLELEAHRAAFRDLTLATDRLELLAALLQALERHHHQALDALGMGRAFERVFLAGDGAEMVLPLIPEYASANVQPLEDGSLRGVAHLFRPA